MRETSRQKMWLVAIVLVAMLAVPPIAARAASGPKNIYMQGENGEVLEYALVDESGAGLETIESQDNPHAASPTEQIDDQANPLAAAPQAAASTQTEGTQSMLLGALFGVTAAAGVGLFVYLDRKKRLEDGEDGDLAADDYEV